QQAGLAFSCLPAHIDERLLEEAAIDGGGNGRDVALLLAEKKAAAIAATNPGAIVIGADQTLSLGPTLLHKPANRAEAAAQLDYLRGKTHRLHAAVALVRDDVLLWSGVETAELTMRDFTVRERDDVLDREGDAALT